MIVIHPSKFFRVMVVVGAAVLVACVLALVGTARPAEAAFPGANGMIAFVRQAEIFTMDPDGTRIRHLRGTNTLFVYDPAWSPDGQKIAFSGYPVTSESVGDVEIYIMDRDGDNLTRLTNNTSSEDYEPAWSPNGRKIAFDRDVDPDGFDSETFVMNKDGSGKKNLTKNKHNDSLPTWQPIVP